MFVALTLLKLVVVVVVVSYYSALIVLCFFTKILTQHTQHRTQESTLSFTYMQLFYIS